MSLPRRSRSCEGSEAKAVGSLKTG